MNNLRDLILEADDLDSDLIEVPEWGATVKVVGMSGAARARVMAMAISPEGTVQLDKIYPELLLTCVLDPETDQPIFLPGDGEAIMQKSGKVVERLAMRAAELSGIEPGGQAKIEKN